MGCLQQNPFVTGGGGDRSNPALNLLKEAIKKWRLRDGSCGQKWRVRRCGDRFIACSFYHHSYRQSNTMPFHEITLNDGRKIPQIGFGSWKIPKDVCTGQVDQAIDIGFDHIDTAQGTFICIAFCSLPVYHNEEEVGQALKESGLARKEYWLTTKWSGLDNKNARQSCEESLEKLGVEYIDLYLIHHPNVTKGDIPGAWKQMEELHKEGKVKSIGVSK